MSRIWVALVVGTAALAAGPPVAAQELAVTRFAASARGSTARYDMTLCNRGRVAARGVWVAFFLDRAAAPPCRAAGDVGGAIDIAAGACLSFTLSSPLPDGIYRSWLFVDATCRVREADEKDNQRAATLKVATGADLRVRAFSAVPVAGGVTVRGTLCRNKVATRPVTVKLWLDRATAPTCKDAAPISAELEVPPDPFCLSFSESFPMAAGAHTARILVDGTCVVAEADESNNAALATYKVGKRCLRNADCGKLEFCDTQGRCGPLAVGTCRPRPRRCEPLVLNPVLGCDRKCYANICEAHLAGVSGNPVTCPFISTCATIDQKYREAVSLARACKASSSARQCTRSTVASLSCPCPTFVNPANTEAARRMAFWSRAWTSRKCTRSPTCRCGKPRGARCKAGSGGAADRCVDYF